MRRISGGVRERVSGDGGAGKRGAGELCHCGSERGVAPNAHVAPRRPPTKPPRACTTGQHMATFRNSSTCGASGAPPETTSRQRPPRRAATLEKTSLSKKGAAWWQGFL